MSRRQHSASGDAGQGPGAGPYEAVAPEYISVSLDCRILKKEKILRGALEVALLDCGGDYYVALFKDGELYRFTKSWDDYTIGVALEPAIWDAGLCECLAWEGTGEEHDPINCLRARCYWKTINDAVYTIMHYQAKADALQKEREAEKVRWLRHGSIYDLA